MSLVNYTRNLVKDYGVPTLGAVFMGSCVWMGVEPLDIPGREGEIITYGSTAFGGGLGFLLGMGLRKAMNIRESTEEIMRDSERLQRDIVEHERENRLLYEVLSAFGRRD